MNDAQAKDPIDFIPESRVGSKPFALTVEQRKSDLIFVTGSDANGASFRMKTNEEKVSPRDIRQSDNDP